MKKTLDTILILTGIGLIGYAIFAYAPVLENDAAHFFQKEKLETRISFVGDIMLDRYIRIQARRLGYDHFFECIKPELLKNDFVVGNLEGSVTSYASVSEGKLQDDMNHFRFTFDPNSLLALKNSGINVVGIANNHIFDFGKEGIAQTNQNILKSELKYFGNPIDENYRTLKLEKDENEIYLVPFNQFFGSSAETISDINKIKSAENFKGIIVVFAHWGDEYVPANENQKMLARKFIDAGADSVIGMHPHVLQETEYYKNKFIAYSLGNFVFDQYFDEYVKRGGVVEMIIQDNKIKSANLRKTYLDATKRVCFE